MKIHGNLVTGCHDCVFNTERADCALTNKTVWNSFFAHKVDPTCPMLQEETHSITIMLSDQYKQDNGGK